MLKLSFSFKSAPGGNKLLSSQSYLPGTNGVEVFYGTNNSSMYRGAAMTSSYIKRPNTMIGSSSAASFGFPIDDNDMSKNYNNFSGLGKIDGIISFRNFRDLDINTPNKENDQNT